MFLFNLGFLRISFLQPSILYKYIFQFCKSWHDHVKFFRTVFTVVIACVCGGVPIKFIKSNGIAAYNAD